MRERVHILIADDQKSCRDMVAAHLVHEGYQVSEAADGRTLREMMARNPAHLVIVNLMLPDEDGFSHIRFLRERYRCGIIMLTARADLMDRVIGLEVGADDYVSKPYEPRELLARVHSLLRRVGPASAEMHEEAPGRNIACFAHWRLDLAARHLLAESGEIVELTNGEFNLLNEFVARPGDVLGREHLLRVVHNRNWDYFDRSIDVLVTRLRRKLEVSLERPAIIKTVHGTGYVFAVAVTWLPVSA